MRERKRSVDDTYKKNENDERTESDFCFLVVEVSKETSSDISPSFEETDKRPFCVGFPFWFINIFDKTEIVTMWAILRIWYRFMQTMRGAPEEMHWESHLAGNSMEQYTIPNPFSVALLSYNLKILDYANFSSLQASLFSWDMSLVDWNLFSEKNTFLFFSWIWIFFSNQFIKESMSKMCSLFLNDKKNFYHFKKLLALQDIKKLTCYRSWRTLRFDICMGGISILQEKCKWSQ